MSGTLATAQPDMLAETLQAQIFLKKCMDLFSYSGKSSRDHWMHPVQISVEAKEGNGGKEWTIWIILDVNSYNQFFIRQSSWLHELSWDPRHSGTWCGRVLGGIKVMLPACSLSQLPALVSRN